ncbi:MAG: hypothetical protein U0441_15235 [Polyangiaceae bacterium]
MRKASSSLRWLVVALVSAGALVVPAAASRSIAHAEDAPLAPGATLVARVDVEIEKVVIAKASRLEVTAASDKTADVALPDGHVLHKIPKARILYFFDVVR